MEIYTSYFGKVLYTKDWPDNIVPVSISLWPDKRFNGAKMGGKLAPLQATLTQYKKDGDWGRYVADFYATRLNKLDPMEIYRELEAISGGKDVALVCFEKTPVRCHRSLVENWLRSAGIETKGELVL